MSAPAENDLKAALVAIKSANPSLGIAKTHTLLLATYPTWVVSEKRTRKLLQHEGLVLNAATPPGTPEVVAYPSSRVIHNLDVHRWTPKVKVNYFDKKKGKGLVATQDIKEGEVIWKEDPFVLAPEWYLSHLISIFSSHPSILVLIDTTSQGNLRSPNVLCCMRLLQHPSGPKLSSNPLVPQHIQPHPILYRLSLPFLQSPVFFSFGKAPFTSLP
jgi:hypothetical protein